MTAEIIVLDAGKEGGREKNMQNIGLCVYLVIRIQSKFVV